MRPVHKDLGKGGVRTVAEALAVAAIALLLAMVIYHATSRIGLTTPFDLQGDALFHTSLARSLDLHGWYTPTPELGAPNGQNLLDFPLGGDHLHLLGLLVLVNLGLGPSTAVNVALLLSYAAVAGTTHLVLRRVGVTLAPAAVGGLLFAFLPFHAFRGVGHLFLSGYYAVPLLLLLVYWLVDDGLLSRRPARLAALAVVVIVAGSASAYYAVFTGILLSAAGALEAARRRKWQPLLAALAVAGAVAIVLTINLTPNLLRAASEGRPAELVRTPDQAEALGLRPAALLLPDASHRVPLLATIGRKVNTVAEPGEAGSYLGVVGVIGVLGLIGAVLARGVGARLELPPLVAIIGGLTIVTLLLATKGGGGFILAIGGLTDLRAWNRMSVVLGLFGLAAVAIALDRLPTRLRAIVLAMVLLFGLADEIPVHVRSTDLSTAEAGVHSDRDFVGALHAALPDGSLLYQLPYVRFPENGPTAALDDYAELRPVLADSGRFRWSYGAIKGRDVEWQESLAALPPDRVAKAVAASGFTAIVVHLLGYADRGAGIDAALRPLVGGPSGQSEDGTLRWYDLRPLAGVEPPLGSALTDPPPVHWSGAQLRAPATYPDNRALGPRVVLMIDAGPAPRHLRLLGRIEAPGHVTVSVPGQVAGASPPEVGDGRLDIAFTAPAGHSEITILIDGPLITSPGDSRDLRGRAIGVVVVDEAAALLVSPQG